MNLKNLLILFLSFIAFSTQASLRAEEAWKRIEDGALLIDVRTPQEYNTRHIPNAVNLPLQTLNLTIQSIPKDKNIVVYCRSGNRSGQAYNYMTKIGFTNVHNGGGFQELISVKAN